MMIRRLLVVLAPALVLGGASPVPGQDRTAAVALIRDGFDGPKPAWRQEQTDATVKIFAHERTRRAAHDGLLSEGFQFEAGIGGGLYYSYALPKIPVTDDLKVSLYVRSNRAGIQVLGRIVLPDDVDPESRRPSFVLVPSTIYETAERWEKITLDDMIPSIERQAKVLRASTRRKVSLEGAYLERLVVNLYGGEGETEVYLDDLTISPVTPEAAAEHARLVRAEAAGTRTNAGAPSARTIADGRRLDVDPATPRPDAATATANGRIKMDRNRLSKDGFPWFPTAMRAPEVDPALIRQVGTDLVVIPRGTDESVVRKAVAAGLFLIPELNTGLRERQVPDPDRMLADATAFPGRDHVFAYSLADLLGKSPEIETRESTVRRIREAALAIRKNKPGGSGLTMGGVVGMFPEYARVPENLDILEIPATSWATVQDPLEAYQYMSQRRLLTARSNPDAPMFAQIDVTPPQVYRETIWGSDRPPAWGLPHVQPEQIRLATYAALAGGARGLVFNADGDLAEGPGRSAMIEVALLNEEIDLLEPILADPDKVIRMTDVYMPDPPPPPPVSLFAINTPITTRAPTFKEFPPHPTIKAAAIGTKDRRGTLLMLADYTKYASFQPPQSATNNIKLHVPAARDAHAYLISPGGVRVLDDDPGKPGGHEITIDDFGMTAIVLVTTNVDLKNQVEASVNANRPRAVVLALEQAELQRAWVAEIDYQLQLVGHPQKESADLIAKADSLIKSSRDALERGDYQVAWDEARRVGRPLRILMRYHFMAAYDELVKILGDEDLPCGPITLDGKQKPHPRLVAPIAAAPLASFSTLPHAWTWINWIKTGKLGRNLVPSGDFNFKDLKAFGAAGWLEDSYRVEEIKPTISLRKKGGPTKGGPDGSGMGLLLLSKPANGLRQDELTQFVDHPVASVRSPSFPVRAREVYRISVMAYRDNQSVPGAGGLIVRDSIGGERLQYRTFQALAMDWFEIVYYRWVPEDGNMTITLGLAGYGLASFDDLKVEPIVEQLEPDQLRVSTRPRRRPAPRPPTPTVEDEPNNPNARPATRTATRGPMFPIRQ